MNTMTRDEMIEFLKGMDCRKKLLDEEKSRIRGSVETMQEAIYRNNFARHDDGSEGTDPGRCSRRRCPAGILRVAKESLFSELNNLMVNTILDEKDSQ